MPEGTRKRAGGDVASRPIYMDHHATTPTDPRVLDAMLPYFCERYGNPASITHELGVEAEQAVEEARQEIAALVGAEAGEIIFTSGATEANNMVLFGLPVLAHGRGHMVTATTEHASVLDPCRELEARGVRVTRLLVDRHGCIDPDQLEATLQADTHLVSIMTANNEIGTLQPLAEIGQICRGRGIPLHTDAAQAAGRIPLQVDALAAAYISLSAHKIYGPKGVGALVVRGGGPARLVPLMRGGRHEQGLRSGTINVPGVVGMGAAFRIARREMRLEAARTAGLRERMLARLTSELEAITVNGHPTRRLPNNLNVSFSGVDGEALIHSLKGVAVSTGSACASAAGAPSHVLQAIGLTDAAVRGSLRFGFGRFNSEAEVDQVASQVIAAVRRLRGLSGVAGDLSPSAGRKKPQRPLTRR